jgi:squalene-hopene/tetraprenyl-beta-curcumene cyclase
VLEAFGAIGMRSCDGDPSIDRAIKYLRTTQEANGCWYGRWGVNYIYGTWQSIEGLRSVGVSVEDSAIVRGADWLASCQQDAGGWGESPLSYADPTWAGCGDLTASQTAWALSGLLSAGRIDSPEVRRGVRWLLSEQLQDGSWEEQAFTGTGFPKVFYLRYHYYPIYFPLISIVKWSCEMEKERVGHSRLGYVA